MVTFKNGNPIFLIWLISSSSRLSSQNFVHHLSLFTRFDIARYGYQNNYSNLTPSKDNLENHDINGYSYLLLPYSSWHIINSDPVLVAEATNKILSQKFHKPIILFPLYIGFQLSRPWRGRKWSWPSSVTMLQERQHTRKERRDWWRRWRSWY